MTASRNQPEQAQLFDYVFLPTWLPDETIFSLASRYHVFNCEPQARKTAKLLFGSQRAGSHHDFPAGIAHFERVTQRQLGDASSIIYSHAILPYYLPFHSIADQASFIAAMQGPLIGSLKYRLGLQRSGLRAHHPLKACPQCMEQDRQQFGTAYWHCHHQYPGIWVCRQHQCYLLEANVKTNGVGRFLWFLPDERLFPDSGQTTDGIELEALPILLSFAAMTEALTSLPTGFAFNLPNLHATYLQQLTQNDWLTSAGSLRLKSLVASFAERYRTLKKTPEFGLFLTSPEAVEKLLTGLLRHGYSASHPFKHLWLIEFLFGDWPTFFTRYTACQDNSASVCNSSDRQQVVSERSDPRLYQLIELLTVQHVSMRQAAQTLNIDFMTASNWAAQAGIATQHRPKTLTQDLRTRVINGLKSGLNKNTVASECKTSNQTVNRILRTEPYLYETWKLACKERLKKHWRNCLLAFIEENPTATRKLIRQQCQAGFIWLYRHDKDWLNLHLPPATPPQKTNYSRTPWAERDQQFVIEIRQILPQLSLEFSGKKIPLWALFQALPSLKAKADQLAKLPKTKQLIHSLCGRIKWNTEQDDSTDLFKDS